MVAGIVSSMKEPVPQQESNKKLPIIKKFEETNKANSDKTNKNLNDVNKNLENIDENLKETKLSISTHIVSFFKDIYFNAFKYNKEHNELLNKLLSTNEEHLNLYKAVNDNEIKRKKIEDTQNKENINKIQDKEEEKKNIYSEKKLNVFGIFKKTFWGIWDLGWKIIKLTFFPTMIKSLGKILWTTVPKLATTLFTTMGSILKYMGKYALKLYAYAGLLESFTTFIDSLKTTGNWITASQDATNALIDFFLNPFYGLIDKALGMEEGRAKKFKEEMVGKFFNGIRNMWNAISDWWNDPDTSLFDLPKLIIDKSLELWSALVAWWDKSDAKKSWENSKTYKVGKEWWDNITGFFEDIWSSIINSVNDFMDNMKTFLRNIKISYYKIANKIGLGNEKELTNLIKEKVSNEGVQSLDDNELKLYNKFLKEQKHQQYLLNKKKIEDENKKRIEEAKKLGNEPELLEIPEEQKHIDIAKVKGYNEDDTVASIKGTISILDDVSTKFTDWLIGTTEEQKKDRNSYLFHQKQIDIIKKQLDVAIHKDQKDLTILEKKLLEQYAVKNSSGGWMIKSWIDTYNKIDSNLRNNVKASKNLKESTIINNTNNTTIINQPVNTVNTNNQSISSSSNGYHPVDTNDNNFVSLVPQLAI